MDTNVIYCGNNLDVMGKYIPDNSVDLIYIDPPFNSNRNYEVFWGEGAEKRAFEDRHGDAMAYLDWMRPRIRHMYRILKPNGSFVYHCDWHASHYVKVELDRVFGFNNFQNEIVWYYRGAGVSKKRFGRRHDVLLWYTKGKNWFFDPDPARQAYAPATVARFKHKIGNVRKGKDFGQQSLNPKGKHPDDVWTDIQPEAPSANARLGYPTQKPLPLMERIISTCSKEGGIVLDAFCGCGTTLEAAAKLKRKWIGIDMSPTACRVMSQRLESRLGMVEDRDFELRDLPKTEADLRRMPDFEFQNWACVALGGIPNKVKSRDFGIDGRLYPVDLEKHVGRRAGKRQKKTQTPEGVQSSIGEFLGDFDSWYPIQVKRIDKVGRPDIDKFQTAMRRDKRTKGYFVAFGFSKDALREIDRANKNDGLDIVPIKVSELLNFERQVA